MATAQSSACASSADGATGSANSTKKRQTRRVRGHVTTTTAAVAPAVLSARDRETVAQRSAHVAAIASSDRRMVARARACCVYASRRASRARRGADLAASLQSLTLRALHKTGPSKQHAPPVAVKPKPTMQRLVLLALLAQPRVAKATRDRYSCGG